MAVAVSLSVSTSPSRSKSSAAALERRRMGFWLSAMMFSTLKVDHALPSWWMMGKVMTSVGWSIGCRIAKLKWKMGKETVGKTMEDHHSLKFNEMAQCSFQPQQPLVCDSFKNCSSTNIPDLGRPFHHGRWSNGGQQTWIDDS